MEGDWLTYAEAAERLDTTPEGVRQRAIRKRWQRTVGNDGLARVRLPDGWPNPVRTPSGRPNKPNVRTPSERRTDGPTIKALEAHVETLKEQLVAAEARLAAAEAHDVQHVADLAAEREKAERAWAELSALAERLAQLAEEANQRRSWWRRVLPLAG